MFLYNFSPAVGVLFSNTIALLYTRVIDCSSDDSPILPALGLDTCEEYWAVQANEMRDKSFMLATYFAILVVDVLAGTTLLYWGFGKASERLSKRIRDDLFTALLRQEVGEYFDLHSVGSITSELQNDAARLHAFSGAPIRQFLIAVSSLLIGVVVAFSVSSTRSQQAGIVTPFIFFLLKNLCLAGHVALLLALCGMYSLHGI